MKVGAAVVGAGVIPLQPPRGVNVAGLLLEAGARAAAVDLCERALEQQGLLPRVAAAAPVALSLALPPYGLVSAGGQAVAAAAGAGTGEHQLLAVGVGAGAGVIPVLRAHFLTVNCALPL